MRLRRGTARKILEVLANGAISTIALSAAIVSSGYGASAWKMQRNADKIERGLRKDAQELIDAYKKSQHFRNVLYRLRQDGLIEQKADGWVATALAKSKILSRLLPQGGYKKEKDDTLKIIIFDIPEKYSRKRDWLRDRLIELGFKMLQKSVWTGKVKLPTEFMTDLKNLDMMEYVDVFAVSKTGSLRPL